MGYKLFNRIIQWGTTRKDTCPNFAVSYFVKRIFPFLMISGFLTSCGLLESKKGQPVTPGKISGKIVFSAKDTSGTYQIFTMNANGSQINQLTYFDTDGGATNPAWSPDGKQIVFANYTKATTLGPYLYVINADGSKMHPLKRMPNESPKYLVGSKPKWSPNGTKIIYDVCLNCEVFGDNYEIMTVNVTGEKFDTTQIHQLTNNPASDMDPDWSPDGSKIAFISNRDYVNTNHQFLRDIYIINVDGTNLRKLTNNGYVGRPIWKSDGKNITFRSSGGKGLSAGVYSIDIHSGNISLVINDKKINNKENTKLIPIKWSPNGEFLLMMSTLNFGSEFKYSLYIIDTYNDSLKNIYSTSGNANPSIEGADWFISNNK